MTNASKNFRIYAKRLFLTYSQVNSAITHEHIIEQLMSKPSLYKADYIVGKENHQDGGAHYHVILNRLQKFQITNASHLDIEYEDQVFHGNYSPVRNMHQAVSYVCKDKNYVTNFENLADGNLLTAKEFIIKEVSEKGIEQALMDHYDRTPNKAIAGMSVGALRKHFNEIEKLKLILQLDKIETPFGLDSFRVQYELKEWIQNPNKTLILVGNSGIGKTQFCKAFVKENHLKTLIISHKEDFKRLNSTYDAIIIDDANIHELEETQLLSVIDNQADKTIRVLYDSVIKKAGIIQLIAMNHNEFCKISYILSQERFARRLLLHKPEKPFIINVNINITNNIVNINKADSNKNIDYKSFQQHQEEEQLHVKKMQQRIHDIASGKI